MSLSNKKRKLLKYEGTMGKYTNEGVNILRFYKSFGTNIKKIPYYLSDMEIPVIERLIPVYLDGEIAPVKKTGNKKCEARITAEGKFIVNHWSEYMEWKTKTSKKLNR